jgi:hypothetical protein
MDMFTNTDLRNRIIVKAFENLEFDKENFESWIDESMSIKLTNDQWEKIVDELDGRVANFLDNLIYDVVQDFKEGIYDNVND